jgi:hypothetical protein
MSNEVVLLLRAALGTVRQAYGLRAVSGSAAQSAGGAAPQHFCGPTLFQPSECFTAWSNQVVGTSFPISPFPS